MRRVTPVFAAHSMSEWATLLPSPTYATTTPRRSAPRPLRSRMVKMSASPWHGCDRSESPLMTGTPLNFANSSMVSCAFTRRTTASAIRLTTRATSATLSRRPSPTSAGDRYTLWPPSCAVPTSKESRVRRLGFSKTSATVRPRRSERCDRSAFSRAVRSRRVPSSSGSRSAIETKWRTRSATAVTRARGGAGAARPRA